MNFWTGLLVGFICGIGSLAGLIYLWVNWPLPDEFPPRQKKEERK